jgi:hypothetical protein
MKMTGRTVLATDRLRAAQDMMEVSSGAKAGAESHNAAFMRRIAAVVDRACRDFADHADWQYGPGSRACYAGRQSGYGVGPFMVTENDRALRVGGYVSVDAMPPANVLKVTAGCYDAYFNPVIVCQKDVALDELNQRKLLGLLDEAHDRLTTYYVRSAT